MARSLEDIDASNRVIANIVFLRRVCFARIELVQRQGTKGQRCLQGLIRKIIKERRKEEGLGDVRPGFDWMGLVRSMWDVIGMLCKKLNLHLGSNHLAFVNNVGGAFPEVVMVA